MFAISQNFPDKKALSLRRYSFSGVSALVQFPHRPSGFFLQLKSDGLETPNPLKGMNVGGILWLSGCLNPSRVFPCRPPNVGWNR